MEKLTKENYFSQEANKEYMSASQFKDFYMKCENEALAKVNGLIPEEKTDALLFGGYVDAYFSNELGDYLTKYHDELVNSRTGELKAPFKGISEVIKTIEEDELLFSYLQGQHQVIMTGKIANVLFKIKVDSLFEDKIVDQKIMKDFALIWNDEKHKKCDFVEQYGYDIQGAIYQEIVRQNTGKKLPFIIAATTKEECPDKALIEIDQEYLDKALELVKTLAPRYDAIKQGLVEPDHCGHCPTCRKEKKLSTVVSYKAMFGKEDEDE